MPSKKTALSKVLSYSDSAVRSMAPVTMTCMTTKQKFEVENPKVVVLANGRYAYRCDVPWEGKNGKKLTAFKFCSHEAYEAYVASGEAEEPAETLAGETLAETLAETLG